MKYMKTLILLCICTVFMCSCGDSDTDKKELSSRYAGEPYSDWEMSPTGSVKYLDNSTVLISIFLEDQDALWSDIDRELVYNNVDIACKYLVDEGERYGKNVELIYDTDKYPDLEYHFTYNKPFPGSASVGHSENEQATVDLVRATQDFISENISVKDIMETYGVNSVGYLIFVDNKTDEACAYNYHYGKDKYYYNEIAFINLRWEEDRNVPPDTYAHEILHLFGARDLYYTSKADNITRDFIDYVYDKYSKDIMLGYASDVVAWDDKITSEITDITAYFIGWNEYISELDDYPEIKQRYVASFTQSPYEYDYENAYKLKSRKMEEDVYKKTIIGKVIEFAIFIFIILSIIRDVKVDKERRILNEAVIVVDDWEDI